MDFGQCFGNHLRVLILCLVVLRVTSLDASSTQAKERHRRSGQRPKLEMSVEYENVTAAMSPGAIFSYKVKVKHSSDSTADAQGVRVLFMLTPFVKFKELKSYEIIKPTHAQHDDSVVFKFSEVIWSSEPAFEMTVIFDAENQLNLGKHHVVTHAQITYYDNYVEDARGQVTSEGTFFSETLETMVFETDVPGCSSRLGIKSKEIHDYQISASSSYPEAQPRQARELDDGWCAKSTKGEQFLQIEFLQKTRVTGLSTIRRQSKPHWITEYFIIYSSEDNDGWRTYTENGFKKLFRGNTISFTPTMHWLANPFDTMSIRIIPTNWEILICLRLELYGCPIQGSARNCISPLGMESGEIPDDALSDRRASVTSSHMIQPKNSRLNVQVTDFPNGWQSTTETEYLQVDFGSFRQVTKVAVQGAYTTDTYTLFFVRSYKLSYSKNKIDWTEYSEKGTVKTFEGPITEYDAKYPVVETIQSPFVARYVRFYPKDGGSAGIKVMRAELYGCFKEALPPYTGASELEFYRRSFIVDTTTDQFYVCMYTDNRAESSCFITNDSKYWTAIDTNIIGMLAINPLDREIYALDRQMKIYRSKDSGASWSQISREYYDDIVQKITVYKAKGIAENFVSSLPTTNTTMISSKGEKWGVSSSNIHFMAAGSSAWSTVGSWRCCGM